jgi:hypothetical protein
MLVLVDGGAAVALLAYLGNLAAHDNPVEHLLERSATQENDGNRRNDENREIMKTTSTLLML